jgi:hypothetical protein
MHDQDKKHDKAVDMTCPASDPTAHGPPTGREPPCRPVDRKAPVITKEQIDQRRAVKATSSRSARDGRHDASRPRLSNRPGPARNRPALDCVGAPYLASRRGSRRNFNR